MTTQENLVETQADEVPAQIIPHYIIDPKKVAERGLSLAVLLHSRRCASSKEKLEAESEFRPDDKQIDKQIKEMAKCCAKKEGFIRPDLSIQEIMFRIILTGANKPISLEQIHHEVTEEWFSPTSPKSITAEGLKRVLDADTYYGFKEVTLAPKG